MSSPPSAWTRNGRVKGHLGQTVGFAHHIAGFTQIRSRPPNPVNKILQVLLGISRVAVTGVTLFAGIGHVLRTMRAKWTRRGCQANTSGFAIE
jgi:hypothetical protein